MSWIVSKEHILSANVSFQTNVLLDRPLYVLKNMYKHFSAIYRQKYNLHFQPFIVVVSGSKDTGLSGKYWSDMENLPSRRRCTVTPTKGGPSPTPGAAKEEAQTAKSPTPGVKEVFLLERIFKDNSSSNVQQKFSEN